MRRLFALLATGSIAALVAGALPVFGSSSAAAATASGPRLKLSRASGAVGDSLSVSGTAGTGCDAATLWFVGPSTPGRQSTAYETLHVSTGSGGTWSIADLVVPGYLKGGAGSAAAAAGAKAYALAGCGGWSRRKTLYGGDLHAVRDDGWLDPAADAAKIRAIFVHPRWARQGVGAALLAAAEAAAAAAGFTRLEMGATLTGAPLYRRAGYADVERVEAPIGGGLTLPVILMAKRLPAAGAGVATGGK